MSLRARIATIAAMAVAVAVLLTSVGIYVATARTLNHQTDRQLQQIADELLRGRRDAFPGGGGPRTGPYGGPGGFVQLVNRDGEAMVSAGERSLPVSARTVELARSGGQVPRNPDRRDAFYETVDAEGIPVRILAIEVQPGVLQIALPVTDTVESLATLRRQLAVGGVLGIVVAAVLGLVVARRAVRPVHDLTELAEDVAATGDLTRRIDAVGDDEVGRLARTFNAMLANLEQARRAQQQLVADASHELRTPLTSLRTNIEVLEHAEQLTQEQRADLRRDVVDQLAEFGRLVDGLVELARGDQPAQAATRVDLAEVVDRAVGRVGTFARDRDFAVTSEPTPVLAEADRLERAVSNLLDNAVKYGEGAIEVEVADGTVRVRDHGPGIADEDLPHVLDRFYRSPEARAAPGSGLGLSIVQQVAVSHGGEVEVRNAPGGGTVVELRLPVA